MKAVCLLSGGMDSCVAAFQAMKEGYSIYALTFDYGQRIKRELESAKEIAKLLNVEEHLISRIDFDVIGGSVLTGETDTAEGEGEIPLTYVPARNTVFIAYALAYAEARNADAIFVGVNAVDYSGYPDCREEYIKSMQTVADIGTRRGVEGKPIAIVAPLINLSKGEIVKRGSVLNVPFEKTWSCYNSFEKACGKCDSCRLRLKGFMEAGVSDPLEYEKQNYLRK